MTQAFKNLLRPLLKISAVLVIANEVRGMILALPVLYAIYEAGGTLAAIWIGICSLGGIALSVIVPMFILTRLDNATRPSPAS